MLVFGHRGVKKTSPENTIAAIEDAISQGADGVEFDIQLTKDEVPVLLHDQTLLRTHGLKVNISNITYHELKQLTADQPVPSLREVLDLFWKKTYLNIEVKSKNTGRAVVSLLATDYIKSEDDWRYCFISSFKIRELRQARQLNENVQLALIHQRVPFNYFWYHRKIKFAAVGFHKQWTHPIANIVARRIGVHTYVYTINRTNAIKIAARDGFDGIITDFPGKTVKVLREMKK